MNITYTQILAQLAAFEREPITATQSELRADIMNSIDEKIRNERDVKELIDLAGNAVARMRTGAAKTSLTERYLDLVVRRAAEDSGQVV